MDRRIAFAAIAVALVALGGTWLAVTLLAPRGPERYAHCVEGAVGGALGGPFELVRETGETVTAAELIDRPTMIYFGYTFCPDVCPVDSARNAVALDLLAERGVDARALFITIDPARDTPEIVGLYAENFHPQMIGLTGTEEQIAAAAGAYRVLYSRAGDDPEFYEMNHSAYTYLAMPEVGFVDFVNREDSPEEIADRLACFAAADS